MIPFTAALLLPYPAFLDALARAVLPRTEAEFRERVEGVLGEAISVSMEEHPDGAYLL